MKPSSQSTRPRSRGRGQSIDRPLGLLATILALSTAYLAILEWRVDQKLKDPAFLKEVAHRVRPALVFNAEGTVIADSGALQFLEESPKVELAKPNEGFRVAEITLKPKTAISEPILESLDISNVSVLAKRGTGLTWKISVIARSDALLAEGQPEITAPPRFRVELTQP